MKLRLENLRIMNLATFKDSEISFDEKLNIVAGETGSGKSLIFDALNVIIGARSDKKMVRKNTEFTSVEATFWCTDEYIDNKCNELGFPIVDNQLIIKRIIYASGKSKVFINFQTARLQDIHTITRRIIDFTGQFENQKLFSNKYQISLLDTYAGITKEVEDYRIQYNKASEERKKLESLITQKSSSALEKDYIKYQLEEVEKLSPSTHDEKELIQKKEAFINIEKTTEKVDQAIDILDGTTSINQLFQSLKRIVINEGSFKPLETLCIDIEDSLYQFTKDFYKVKDSLETTDNIDDIISRLDQYETLKRKFNVDTQGLSTIHEELTKKMNSFENIDEEIKKTEIKIIKLEKELLTKAKKISSTRKNKALELQSKLQEEIRNLNMLNASLKFQFIQLEKLNETGIDSISIIVETNKNEGFYPLKDIVSGGELSRILLALRVHLNSSDSISIFLFDEVDSGIGGKTAIKIGESLKKISQNSQVIAISHLPQVTFYADQIIKVTKEFKKEEDRTVSVADILKTEHDKNNYLASINELPS